MRLLNAIWPWSRFARQERQWLDMVKRNHALSAENLRLRNDLDQMRYERAWLSDRVRVLSKSPQTKPALRAVEKSTPSRSAEPSETATFAMPYEPAGCPELPSFSSGGDSSSSTSYSSSD